MAKRNAGFTSITRRWLRGSLLITAILVVVAETLFLYSSYQDLYGGVRQAVLSRFSTIEGQLSATGTAGDESDASASRGLLCAARWNCLMKKINLSSCFWMLPVPSLPPPAAPFRGNCWAAPTSTMP